MLLWMELKTCLERTEGAVLCSGYMELRSAADQVYVLCLHWAVGGNELGKQFTNVFLIFTELVFCQPDSLNPGCSRVLSAWAHGWEQDCPFSSGLSDSWAVTWNPQIEKLKPRSAFISESSIKAQFLLHRNVLLDSAFFQLLVWWRMTTGFPCCSQWVKKHFIKSKSHFLSGCWWPWVHENCWPQSAESRAVLSLQCPFPCLPC